MTKVYSPPQEIPVPDLTAGLDFNQYFKDCDNFEAKLRDWCKENSRSPEAGEIVSFPVADGAARYMVFTMKPIALIHIPTGDGWHFQYVDRLRAADIRERIKRSKGLRSLFGG